MDKLVTVDKLITALAPVFAAGLGIQQLMEMLSPLLDKISADYKKIIIGLMSLVVGLLLAFNADLHVLQSLGLDGHPTIDHWVTGFIISGGTEGVNSILKFLKYSKEDKKNEAAAKTPSNANAVHAATVPVPTKAALTDMNLK
jgi:hypothetical protein